MANIIPKGSSKKKITSKDGHIVELKKLLNYYKEITETVREPFLILDKNLYVVTANSSFYQKFKVNKKNTEGRLIYELGNNQWDAPDLRTLLEDILPNHKVLNNYEVTHDFPNLGHRSMLLNARQVDSKQLILLAIEDVTEKSKLQASTDKVNANLIKQRDKLQRLNNAKEEFISLASHQLRTPATVVKQYIGMLSQGLAGNPTKAQMKMLSVAYGSNERQLEIIEDLLRVAKVDAGKVYLEKTPCDMSRQIEMAIRAQAILFEGRGQRVMFTKPKEKMIANVDPKLMLMVLENVLDNAGKYSPHGGQVVIRVEQTDGQTIISVQDNGVGIKKADSHKLFRKFVRIDNPLSILVAGTGLGLYWVKKILDLHGGSIEVTSKLNEGSTFTIKTPIGTAL